MSTLTDAIIASSAIEPGHAARKLADGHSLYLRLTLDGRRRWYVRIKGSDHLLGDYPGMSVEAARQTAAERRSATKSRPAAPAPALTVSAAVAQASAPVGAVPTFGTVAEHWAPFDQGITAGSLRRKLEHIRNKMAELHPLPVAGVITVAQCKAIFERVRADSGLSTAMRCGRYLSAIFEHAPQQGLSSIYWNPAKGYAGWVGRTDKQQLAARRQKFINPSKQPDAFGLMMEKLDVWQSPIGPTSTNFVRLIARVPVRASEMAGAKWSEFTDLDDPAKALWTIPASRMKQRKQHEVPLSRQALAILEEQRRYAIGVDSPYVFPHRDRPGRHIKGDNQRRTLSAQGYGPDSATPHSVHGFRYAFETYATDNGRDPFVAHRYTAHAIKGVMGRYNVSTQVQQLREIGQWWADAIDAMVAGYKV